jgi:hypothetical protein
VEFEQDNPLLARGKVKIPTEFYRRLDFETGEEPYISIGVSTKIIPYYAKIRYLLDPKDESSPYYLFSIGVNLVDGEEVEINKFLDDLSQRINYGVGVGITLKNLELEMLYGRYNYEMIRVPQQEENDLYSSTKLTFNCKYKF